MTWIKYFAAALIPQAILAAEPVALSFDVSRGDYNANILRRDLAKHPHAFVKRDALGVNVFNYQETSYVVTLGLGSDQQSMTVQIDTGSSDLWVMGDKVKCLTLVDPSQDEDDKKMRVRSRFVKAVAGSNSSEPTGSLSTATTCTRLGSFKTDSSTSFKKNETAPLFNITYLDGSGSSGIWGSDLVVFGTTTIKDVIFAIANVSTTDTGILGVGLRDNEASQTTKKDAFDYDNFPLRLKAQGLISKVAYSLYLDEGAELGKILFGGVDEEKYSGSLVTLPMVNGIEEGEADLPHPTALQTVVDGIMIVNGLKNISLTSNKYVTLFDSGSTSSVLPDTLFAKLTKVMSAKYDAKTDNFGVDCGLAFNLSMIFNYGGVSIPVPMTEIVKDNGQGVCWIGMNNATALGDELMQTIVLGDDVLRHLYLVYNLEDYEISVAKVAYSSSNKVKNIESDVPGATRAADYSSTYVATNSEGSATATMTTNSGKRSSTTRATGSSSSATSATSTHSKKGNAVALSKESMWATAALGVFAMLLLVV